MIKKKMVEQEWLACDFCGKDITAESRNYIESTRFLNREEREDFAICHPCSNERLIPWIKSQIKSNE